MDESEEAGVGAGCFNVGREESDRGGRKEGR